jgi:predicted Zn-dependent protease
LLAFGGETKRVIEETRKAIGLSPRDPFMAICYLALAAAAFANDQYEEAANWAKRPIIERPGRPSGHRVLAARYGRIGRIEEGRAAVKEVLKLILDQTLRSAKMQLPYRDTRALDTFVEGLAKSGVPA